MAFKERFLHLSFNILVAILTFCNFLDLFFCILRVKFCILRVKLRVTAFPVFEYNVTCGEHLHDDLRN